VLARRHGVADEDIEHAVTNAKGLTRRRRSSTSRSLGSDQSKMAAFGMKWSYKSQLDALERHLGN
jgi:hypothetical protein